MVGKDNTASNPGFSLIRPTNIAPGFLLKSILDLSGR